MYDVTIGPDGTVGDVRLARSAPDRPGYREMDEAVQAAVRTWRYTTTEVEGKAVPVCMVVSATIDVR